MFRKDNCKITRLMTINQIAINYVLGKWKRLEFDKTEPFFWNIKTSEARRTFREEEIHAAYRGGRNEAFKTGHFEGVTAIDINSLYPHATMIMKCPDLRTERLINNPLRNFETHEILSRIGITQALIKNVNNDIGIVPARTKDGNKNRFRRS